MKCSATWCLVLGVLACAQSAWAQQTAPGDAGAERLYQAYCSVCHGDQGDGRSRAAANLVPRPRDFTAPQAAVELTLARMTLSIREGRPGTAMVPWKSQLSDEQIAALARFIRDRFMVPTAYAAGSEGRRIYAEFCSVCHGDKGNGISRASRSLQPPPRDFTSDQARRELTRERMVFAVTYGRPNTAMAGWQTQLSPGQIEAAVDYVRASFMRAGAAPHDAPGPHVAGNRPAQGSGTPPQGTPRRHAEPQGDPAVYFAQPYPGGLKGDQGAGRGLYAFNCVPCHGERGDGNGPRAFFILPKPRDFGHPAARASLNRPLLFEGIAKGIRGSEMPAWEKVFSPKQIADVSEYVLGAFIRPPGHGATTAGHAAQRAGGEARGQ